MKNHFKNEADAKGAVATTKNKRGQKRTLLVIVRDNERLDLVGVYLNANHAEDDLKDSGIWNANIGKYINYKIDTLNGFIAVNVDIGKSSLSITDVIEKGKILAKNRRTQNNLLKLNADAISKLTPDQTIRIKAIIDENTQNENTNTENG